MDQIQLLQFETATTCTGNCSFCPHDKMKPRKQMPLTQIIDLCYNLAHTAKTVCPFGIQEPFLDSRIDKICSNVKLFNPRGKVTIYTTFPTYPKRQLENIVRWGLVDTLIVSYYGGTKEVHDCMQPGIDYKQAANNIKRFMRLKQRLNYHIPEVKLAYLVTKETYPNIKRFERQWRHKVDSISYFRYYSWHDSQPYDEKWEEQLWGKPAERVPCKDLYSGPFIHSNGNVVSCCLDYDEVNVVGNIFTDWRTWWNSQKMKDLRQLHEEGRWDENPLCAKCTKWRYNHTEEWINYWKKNKTYIVESAVNL